MGVKAWAPEKLKRCPGQFSLEGRGRMTLSIEQVLRPELGCDERLLWSGVPRQGLLLRTSDIVAVSTS